MPTDLEVVLQNVPGTLASMGEALGRAGVNIEGLCGVESGGEGVVHLLVEDAAGARSAVEGAGHQVRGERNVLVADIDNRPGAFGETCRRIANAGANIDLVYVTADGRIVLGGDDLDKARSAL
ncbi:MAG TPA: amino acid-binding protein [Actinomycetota bacterium]|nr:amino acid-binding protein [Actinomycetota bacterium]